jgi:hypothetical protein
VFPVVLLTAHAAEERQSLIPILSGPSGDRHGMNSNQEPELQLKLAREEIRRKHRQRRLCIGLSMSI